MIPWNVNPRRGLAHLLAGHRARRTVAALGGRFRLQLLAEERGFRLHEQTIGATDFAENIREVIYHLDYPVAGPGSFPQYMVSGLASQHMKVVLGGQGGDEVFGGVGG